MNYFALTSLYRSLTRHKFYAVLNIGGLAVGIAVFFVLALYVRFETSYEKWLPDHHKIYVVQSVWNTPGSPQDGAYNSTMGSLFEQLKEDFPDIVGTRIRSGPGSVLRDGVATSESLAQVDPSFFEVFDLPMIRGDGKRALRAPTAVVISESTAHKYFGGTDPIGQTMTIVRGTPASFRVTGVFRDLPKNSDFDYSILILLPNITSDESWFHWGNRSLETYLRFDDPAAARAFAGKLKPFVDRRGVADLGENPSARFRLALLPLDRVHLEPEGQASSSKKMQVVTLGLVGFLAFLIAIVNYINLATARAGLRSREVAMRKVLGAHRSTLIRQFMGESMLTVAIAALVGLILSELSLPLINAAGGLSLSIPYTIAVPVLLALIVIGGTIAGFYPAIMLSRFSAAAVLASARTPGGGRTGTRIRETLVVFQFSLAIAFIIATSVLVAQIRHVRQSDLGFKRDGLLIIRSFRNEQIDDARGRALLASIRRIPGVTGVAIADSAAGGSGSDSSINVPLPGVPGKGPSLRKITTGAGFFDVYGARLLAGRVFDDAHGGDDMTNRAKSDGQNIVINRRAVGTLRFRSPEDAIGKTVGGDEPRTIIGVIDDMRFFSPRLPNDATYYLFRRDLSSGAVATVRFSGDPRSIVAAAQQIWRRTAPQVPFAGETADRRLDLFYEADDRAARLFGIGAGLAVLIGVVGLWGLASFNTQRRIKEIGIRKVLGASSPDIVKLLVGQFMRPVLIANLIAWPLAFLAMRTWLAGFEDRIALSPLYFIGATLFAIGIAVLTVIGQALRASRAAPSWALRHD
ncbi:ABC transporter permease [Sphingomonas pokkalii]|uniref:Transporter n=1 Tax=Sphingomonas pokkalii TaxID=2175090 RepID=A0A2U0SC57_9SPHN|nr:ABC transporter permease [Sphingomonas pokkalii]PVX28855.1 transporter [Sphingomonas pokkalii]